MKKFLFILLVCFAAISCNSYDDEVGYIAAINGTVESVISANHTSCTILYGKTIKTEGNIELSKVAFKVSGKGEEEILDAQKGEANLYYAEIKIPYDKNIEIATIATINGEDVKIYEDRTIRYTTMDFAPDFADSIQTNSLNYDVVRYCVNIVRDRNNPFKNKISTARVTIGNRNYPLTMAADGNMYCDINLYDITYFKGNPSLTIKNEIDEYTLTGQVKFEVKKEAITDYNTSDDGKEIDGCIYLAGTKWVKGVLVKDSDGKSYVNINDELGSVIKNEYELDKSTTPSLKQAEDLIKYYSIQRIKTIESGLKNGMVAYPAKNEERIMSSFDPIKPSHIADIRNKGVYINTQKVYGSPRDKYSYYNYIRYFYVFKSAFSVSCLYDYLVNWGDCYKMPIKE